MIRIAFHHVLNCSFFFWIGRSLGNSSFRLSNSETSGSFSKPRLFPLPGLILTARKNECGWTRRHRKEIIKIMWMRWRPNPVWFKSKQYCRVEISWSNAITIFHLDTYISTPFPVSLARYLTFDNDFKQLIWSRLLLFCSVMDRECHPLGATETPQTSTGCLFIDPTKWELPYLRASRKRWERGSWHRGHWALLRGCLFWRPQ